MYSDICRVFDISWSNANFHRCTFSSVDELQDKATPRSLHCSYSPIAVLTGWIYIPIQVERDTPSSLDSHIQAHLVLIQHVTCSTPHMAFRSAEEQCSGFPSADASKPFITKHNERHRMQIPDSLKSICKKRYDWARV